VLSGSLVGTRRTAGPRRGDVLVAQAQRSRMLSAAAQVIAEHGYGQMSVARVATGAGVSRRTFYDHFEDREDCFLAVFDEVLARAETLLRAACEPEHGWREQTRAALSSLLALLDEEPAARALLIVDALKAGHKVQQRRSQVLTRLSAALHEAASEGRGARELPPLTSEGLIGAVFSLIHTRLLSSAPGAMLELLNPLMGTIVLPYLGPVAAQQELLQRVPTRRPASGSPTPREVSQGNPMGGVSMRMTHRTLLVLRVIAEQPGASNRGVARAADVTDQGQISKLLARLEGLGLIENKGEGQLSGEPNAWQLTAKGQELEQAIRAQSGAGQHERNNTRESH